MAKRLTYIVSAVLLLCSCESEYQSSLADQEGYIESYISSNYGDCEVTLNEGVSRVTLSQGYGLPAEEGDRLTVHCVGYTFGSSGPQSKFTELELTFTLGEDDIIEGLEKGLTGVSCGETCLVLFSARYGYGNSAVGVVPEATALAFTLQVKSIVKAQN